MSVDELEILSVQRFARHQQVEKRRRLELETDRLDQNERTSTWSVLGAVAVPMLAHIVELLGEIAPPTQCDDTEADTQGTVQSPLQVAQTLSSLCRTSAQFLLQHAVFLAREELIPSVDWLVNSACWERKQERAFIRLMQWNLIVDEALRLARQRSDIPLSHCGFQASFDQRVATAVLLRMRVL